MGIGTPQVVSAASLGCALAAAVCAWRVYRQRLVTRYPAFFCFLLAETVLLPLSVFVGVTSKLYAWTFILTYPISWMVYGLMVRELYHQIFGRYPGIATFGTWSVYAAVFFSGLLALITNVAARGVLTKGGPILNFVGAAGRNVVFGLALSIIVLLLLISRYPLDLHRNVFVNCLVFSALLLAEALQMLTVHLTNRSHVPALNTLLMLVNTLAFLLWAFLLTRQGATQIIHIHHGNSEEEERRLLNQLKVLSEFGTRRKK